MVQEASRWEALLVAEQQGGKQDAGPASTDPLMNLEALDQAQAFVPAVVVVDLDMETLPEGSAARQQFEARVAAELTAALRIQNSQIVITAVSSPGGVVDFQIKGDNSGSVTAAELRDELYAQIADEDSELFSQGGMLRDMLNPTASITALSAIVLADKTKEASQLRQAVESSTSGRVAVVARLQQASARAAVALEYDCEISQLRVSVRVLEAEKSQLLAEQV